MLKIKTLENRTNNNKITKACAIAIVRSVYTYFVYRPTKVSTRIRQ